MAIRRLGLGLATVVAALGFAAPSAGASEVGLGSCGWARPNLNVFWPDENAVYYVVNLPAPPPGVTYRIRGEFPHSRSMSFTAYNGLPMDSLLDVDIPPDPGSVNPFVPGADRTAANRNYTVKLVPKPPPADPADREPGALYVGGGQLGSPAPGFYILYRIYLPDRGTGPAGGVPLPTIEASGPGAGQVGLSSLPCDQAHHALDALPLSDLLDGLYANASPPVTAPVSQGADDPPSWEVNSGATARVLGGAGQDIVSGGPFSNPDNRYLSAVVSRALGDVIAIHGKAPTHPATYDGEPVMGKGDVRYWSFCQNSRWGRYVGCLADEQIELDKHGYYTIAISDPANRPKTARNWLPFGPEPEGLVIYRHMRPSRSFFKHSIQGAAESDEPLEQAMGPYYPQIAYCSIAEFDKDACGLSK